MDTVITVPRSEHVPKLLRLPTALAQRIEEEARRGYRPFTAQVIMMLEQWFEERDGKHTPGPKPSRPTRP